MQTTREWLRDESVQVGADFASPAEVQDYIDRLPMDVDAANATLDRLGVGPGQVLIDIGAGPGSFALEAARRCKTVHVVDMSAAMLDVAKQRAEQAGLSNVQFHRAGFLTYRHDGAPADIVTTHKALHHLPDAWKAVAFARMAEMLHTGGILHLVDVIYTGESADYEAVLDGVVSRVGQSMGEDIGRRVIRHIRDEFSTWDWIIEGMITRAGFRIDAADYSRVLAELFCTKVTSAGTLS